MSDPLQKSSELALAGFDNFIVDRTSKIEVKVFLCGKALLPTVSLQEQADEDLRAYLLIRLEQEVGCKVFLGEHNQLIRTYHKAVGYALPADGNLNSANLTLFEASLADYVDLIVIFQDSPGSFAELGMFSVASSVCPKLLLIIKSKYEGVANFINRGPVVAAKNNRAQVQYVDYNNRGKIYEVVQSEIFRIRETLASQDLWHRRSNRWQVQKKSYDCFISLAFSSRLRSVPQEIYMFERPKTEIHSQDC